MNITRHHHAESIWMDDGPLQQEGIMDIERRSLERLKPSSPMEILVKLDQVIVGDIVNITTRGLAVAYRRRKGEAATLERNVSIVMPIDLRGALLVAELRCRRVYDIPALACDQPFQGAHMRQCGLMYAHDAQVDQSMLRHLLAAIG